MRIRDAAPDITFNSLVSSTDMVGIGDRYKRRRIKQRAVKKKPVIASNRTKDVLNPKDKIKS